MWLSVKTIKTYKSKRQRKTFKNIYEYRYSRIVSIELAAYGWAFIANTLINAEEIVSLSLIKTRTNVKNFEFFEYKKNKIEFQNKIKQFEEARR